MAIKLKANTTNLDLKTNIGATIKGDDGGYYSPAVDGAGNLTWTPSLNDMPAVEGTNIMGPTGESGVYVGTEEPTNDEILVWINPEGEASGNTGGDVDLTGYATEEYVDNAIANIPAPDLTDYALKSEIPSVEGLASEEYVTNAISTALEGIANAEDGAY